MDGLDDRILETMFTPPLVGLCSHERRTIGPVPNHPEVPELCVDCNEEVWLIDKAWRTFEEGTVYIKEQRRRDPNWRFPEESTWW